MRLAVVTALGPEVLDKLGKSEQSGWEWLAWKRYAKSRASMLWGWKWMSEPPDAI
jgi:hypothetical protein